MVAFIKFFLLVVIFVFILCAIFGIIAFFRDLHNFKTNFEMSLPREKLIEKIIEQTELSENQNNSDESEVETNVD